MVSRQAIQWHAGHTDADFHKLDEDNMICSQLNQEAINWAMGKASASAKNEYNAHGKKLKVAEDKVENMGPAWIWEYLSYEDNSSKTETTLRSVTMRLPMDYWEIEVQGNHYCKLLSPYRALEWIYIDSLKDYSKKMLAGEESNNLMFLQE